MAGLSPLLRKSDFNDRFFVFILNPKLNIMNDQFTVYVLYSPKYGKIYIGFTSNLEQRLLAHNVLEKKGWTIRFRPWVIVFTEEYPTKKEAMRREKLLNNANNRALIWDIIRSSDL